MDYVLRFEMGTIGDYKSLSYIKAALERVGAYNVSIFHDVMYPFIEAYASFDGSPTTLTRVIYHETGQSAVVLEENYAI